MLRLHSLVAAIVALMLLTACGGGGEGGEAGQAEVEPLETLTAGAQQASYALGVDLGRQVAGMPGADDHDQVVRALHDQLAGDARLDFQSPRGRSWRCSRTTTARARARVTTSTRTPGPPVASPARRPSAATPSA